MNDPSQLQDNSIGTNKKTSWETRLTLIFSGITALVSLPSLGLLYYNNERTIENDRSKSVQERFLKAAESASSKDNVNARLSGIIMLGELASSTEKLPIIDLLSSLIRENAKAPKIMDKNHYAKDEAPSDAKMAILTIKRIINKKYEDENKKEGQEGEKKLAAVHPIDSLFGQSDSNNCSQSKKQENETKEKFTIDLRNTNLSKSDFEYGHFECTDFRNSDLYGTSLRDSFLNNSILKETTLISAGMEGADLTNANLEKADLTKAILTKAKLEGANLTDAYLAQANLDGAEDKGLTYDQLEKSCYANEATNLSSKMQDKLDKLEEDDPSEKREGCKRWKYKRSKQQQSQKQESENS